MKQAVIAPSRKERKVKQEKSPLNDAFSMPATCQVYPVLVFLAFFAPLREQYLGVVYYQAQH